MNTEQYDYLGGMMKFAETFDIAHYKLDRQNGGGRSRRSDRRIGADAQLKVHTIIERRLNPGILKGGSKSSHSRVTIIGPRGHSGTRSISHPEPPAALYGAQCSQLRRYAPPRRCTMLPCAGAAHRMEGRPELGFFSALQTMDIPAEVHRFADDLPRFRPQEQTEHKAGKYPETTLIYPWLTGPVIRKFN